MTAPQSRLPERNLAACTRIEADASFYAPVPHCTRSRMVSAPAESRGNLLWHTASLAPRGPAALLVGQLELLLTVQTGEACLFGLLLLAGTASPTCAGERIRPGPGANMNNTRPVRLQTSRLTRLAHRLRVTTRCPPAEARFHAA